MNKAELSNTIAERTGVTRAQAESMIETFVAVVTEELKQGNEVTIASFGTFLSRVRASRMGVNPRHPEQRIQVPEIRVAKFKTGKGLKEALKAATIIPSAQTAVANQAASASHV